jgi:hypothetical protein
MTSEPKGSIEEFFRALWLLKNDREKFLDHMGVTDQEYSRLWAELLGCHDFTSENAMMTADRGERRRSS